MPKKPSKYRMYRDIQFEKIAKEFGLSYSYNDEFSLINLLRDFRLLKKGGGGKIMNIIGEKTELYESDFRIFDYQYSIKRGESQVILNQTVFFVQSKNMGLPQFYMEPERFFKKVAKYLKKEDDIDFEAFPQFSDEYWLKGPEEGQIRKAMSEDLLHYFTVEKDWSLEGLNYFLIFYKKGTIIPSTDLMEFYQKGKEIVKMFSKST